MSASGLPGNRDDSYRAGMTAMTDAGGIAPRKPVGDAGGTANLNTAARDCTVGERGHFAGEASGVLPYERAQLAGPP